MKRVFCSRRLRKEDMLFMQQWLREPYVRPWWRDSEWSRRQLSGYFVSRSKTKRYIIQALQRKPPIGYAQIYPVDEEHEYAAYRSSYGSTVGVDLFIGDPSYVGKGLGEPFWRMS